jgi:hypothetical protein
MVRIPYFAVNIEYGNKTNTGINIHNISVYVPIFHPRMMMENLFLMILYFAFIGAIEISTTIALYSIILGFSSANHA